MIKDKKFRFKSSLIDFVKVSGNYNEDVNLYEQEDDKFLFLNVRGRDGDIGFGTTIKETESIAYGLLNAVEEAKAKIEEGRPKLHEQVKVGDFVENKEGDIAEVITVYGFADGEKSFSTTRGLYNQDCITRVFKVKAIKTR